ncbi:MAG TPA: hypothetical protein VIU11_11450 [Nakamurella sp.]
MRLALDQNFPIPLINAVRDSLPPTLQLSHLKAIDRRMPELDDRLLIIALHQTGWDGLITNNYKMLDVPAEVAAIVKTKLTSHRGRKPGARSVEGRWRVAARAPQHPQANPTKHANVLRLAYRQRPPTDTWERFKAAAARRHRDPDELWREIGFTDQELETPILH